MIRHKNSLRASSWVPFGGVLLGCWRGAKRCRQKEGRRRDNDKEDFDTTRKVEGRVEVVDGSDKVGGKARDKDFVVSAQSIDDDSATVV